jgi:hypothetical protein
VPSDEGAGNGKVVCITILPGILLSPSCIPHVAVYSQFYR